MQTITKEVPSAFGEVAGNILGKMADAATTVALAGEIGPLSKVVGSKVNDGVNFIVQNTFTDTITTTVPKTVVLPPSTTNKIASFISQNAGKIGVAISVLGAAWSIYSVIKRNRDESVSFFSEVANEVSQQLVTGAKQWIAANIDPLIAECEAGIEEIYKTEIKFNSANKNLTQLLERTEKLIHEIS